MVCLLGCLDELLLNESNSSFISDSLMNMFARFDEIPAITLQDIKETK